MLHTELKVHCSKFKVWLFLRACCMLVFFWMGCVEKVMLKFCASCDGGIVLPCIIQGLRLASELKNVFPCWALRCQTSLFDHLMFFLSLFLVSVETFLILQSQFWREKTQELVQIFLGKTHYSPLIYMQSWHGAVKLLSIRSCRGEEENTSGCGHSSVLPSQPRVCLTLCSPQQVFVCQVQPGSPGWFPQHHCHEKYQAAPPRVYLAVNTGGHCILQGVCLPQQHTKIQCVFGV